MVCFVTDFTLFVADRLPPMRICDEKREYAMHADRSLRFDLEVADRQDMVTMPIFDAPSWVLNHELVPLEAVDCPSEIIGATRDYPHPKLVHVVNASGQWNW